MPKKLIGEKLNVNLLVPFPESISVPIKKLAENNGMATTQMVRLLIMKGLDGVRSGQPLVLRGLEEVTK